MTNKICTQIDVYDQIYSGLKNWTGTQKLFYSSKPLREVVVFLKWVSRFQKTGSLLDVGCGAGRHSVLFAKNGYNVTGIDYSEIGINHAKKLAKRNKVQINFVCTNFITHQLESKYNIIVDIGCFHHVKQKNRKKYVNKLVSSLNQGGFLMLRQFSTHTQEFSGIKIRNNKNYVLTNNQKHYSYFFKPNELDKLFSDLKLIKKQNNCLDGKCFKILYLQKM